MKTDILQGIWKLEEAFGFDHSSQKYNKIDLGDDFNYFEFRGDRFCTGNLDKNGVLSPCSRSASFANKQGTPKLTSPPKTSSKKTPVYSTRKIPTVKGKLIRPSKTKK